MLNKNHYQFIQKNTTYIYTFFNFQQQIVFFFSNIKTNVISIKIIIKKHIKE